MAKIDIRDRIAFSQDRVYETFRDDLEALQPYLPTVESITKESFERVDDDTVEAVRIWRAADKDIPTLAQKFIKPEMLRWTDRATWKDDETLCHWDIEVGFLKDAIKCHGTTNYVENAGVTEVHITGDLQVDASKIPGVPRLLAGKVGDAVEKFVVKMITPNLKEVNRGMEKYLKEKG